MRSNPAEPEITSFDTRLGDESFAVFGSEFLFLPPDFLLFLGGLPDSLLPSADTTGGVVDPQDVVGLVECFFWFFLVLFDRGVFGVHVGFRCGDGLGPSPGCGSITYAGSAGGIPTFSLFLSLVVVL